MLLFKQKSLIFFHFGFVYFEELSGALEAHAVEAVVKSPSFETEIAPLELALVIAAFFLPLRSVDLNSFQPAGQEIADHWVTILALALYLVLSTAAAFAHKFDVVRRKLGDKRQYLFNIVANVVLVFAGIFQPKTLLVELRL